MSATAFDPIKAVQKHANVPIDATSGLLGMEAAGLLLTKATTTPESDLKTYNDHNMEECVHIFRNHRLTIDLEGQYLTAAGSAANKHPGRPLSKAVMTEFTPSRSHEFNTAASGYFLILNPKATAGQGGDLDEFTMTAKWFAATRNGTSQLVAAP